MKFLLLSNLGSALAAGLFYWLWRRAKARESELRSVNTRLVADIGLTLKDRDAADAARKGMYEKLVELEEKLEHIKTPGATRELLNGMFPPAKNPKNPGK